MVACLYEMLPLMFAFGEPRHLFVEFIHVEAQGIFIHNFDLPISVCRLCSRGTMSFGAVMCVLT